MQSVLSWFSPLKDLSGVHFAGCFVYPLVGGDGLELPTSTISKLRAARQESMTPLYAWSVHARLGMTGAIIVLVIIGLAKPAMLGFAVTELAGSLWTVLALRAEISKVSVVPGKAT
jgi:hypothetical protein